MKQFNVLGTVYTIKETNEKSDPRLKECDGYCDYTLKVCGISDMVDAKNDIWAKGNLDEHKKKVIRHELIHAFLYESGLGENSWAWNEAMVDWIAYQFPKLMEAFKELDCSGLE